MVPIENSIKKITRALSMISGAFLFLMMVLTILNILIRIPFSSMRGITELVSYSFIVVIFFGLAYTAITHSNVEVDILTSKLPPRLRKIIAGVICILNLSIWGIITWQNCVFSFYQWKLGEYSPVLDMKLMPIRAALVLGCIILCIVLIIDLLKSIRRLIKNESGYNRDY